MSSSGADSMRPSGSRREATRGAKGWVGRATLEMLAEALGPAGLRHRVLAFGATDRRLVLRGGLEVEIAALDRLDSVEPRPALILHYAFLGREKTAEMPLADYVAANARIGAILHRAIERLRPAGLFLSSSGAAVAGGDLAANPYGVLKRRDETEFAAASAAAGTRLIMARIFNLAGPYINKLAGYALASFLLDALAGRPVTIRAARRVERSYVHVGDVVALALAALLDPAGDALAFETAGERVVEVGDLARLLLDTLGRPDLPIERPAPDPALPADRYVGDPAAMRALAARHGLALTPLPDQIRHTADYIAGLAGLPAGAAHS